MLARKASIAMSVSLLLLTAGCSSLFGSSVSQNDQTGENAENEDGLVAITDYTGEGYGLSGHDEEEEIGLANREEVEEAAKSYMKEFYNTDVEVQRIFGSPGAVTVIVRSTEEAVFNTYVIVPVDVETGQVIGEETFSEKGQVESAIISGVYYLAHKKELDAYEEYLKGFAMDNGLAVMREETVQTIRFNGYSTPYFSIYPTVKGFESILETYSENPSLDSEWWRENNPFFTFSQQKIIIGTDFYMNDERDPDKNIYEKLIGEVKEMDDLPRGQYAFELYDNTIEPRSGTNNHLENSISYIEVDEIMKD